MTHQNDYTFAQDLTTKGLEAIPELLRVLINNAMQVERTQYLQASEYERTQDRRGPVINPKRSGREWERSLLQYRRYEKVAFFFPPLRKAYEVNGR